MPAPVRAVYEGGRLRPLEPVNLEEGQTVRLAIILENAPVVMTPDEVDSRLRAVGLLAEVKVPEDAVELTPEERRRIGALFTGDRLSEVLIDEDRGEC